MWIPCTLFLVVLQTYLYTHCASFNINDSGETILVCTRFTISHSPGYPLHALWGKLNDVLFPFGQPMLRVTLASIWTASFSAVLLYLILRRTLAAAYAAHSKEEVPAWTLEVPALSGSLIFAYSYQHWFQAGGAKGGIYTLNTALLLAVLFIIMRMDHRGRVGKSLILVGLLVGLCLAHHWPNLLVMVPAYVWFLFTVQTKVPLEELKQAALKPASIMLFGVVFFLAGLFFLTQGGGNPQESALLNFTMLLGKSFLLGLVPVTLLLLLKVVDGADVVRSVGAGVLGVSPYVFLAIRADQNPVVSWWNPNNAVRLWETVIRKGYSNIGDPRSMATLTRNLKRFFKVGQDQFGTLATLLVVALAVAGFFWLWRRRKDMALGFAILGGSLWTGIMVFNNPAEGYQWTLDNFFVPVYLTFALFAALGLAWLLDFLRQAWPDRSARAVLAGIILSVAILPLTLNWKRTDQSRYVSAYDYGLNMLLSINRTGVILCNGDIDILPLWYLQLVQGMRPEVENLTMQLIPYDWYRNPLFKMHPDLAVPVGDDIRPQTVVQNMINYHAKEKSFYYTNIFTAPWMRTQNPSMTEGFMWRITTTKDLDYPFTSNRVDFLWSHYRLRSLDEPDRGYWDEYTDVMKDSYGIGHDFTGYFCLSQGYPAMALWCFQNAIRYRQPQTLSRIHMMMSQAYLQLHNLQGAYDEAQKGISLEPGNPFGYLRLGDALLSGGNLEGARQSYETAQRIAPQLPDVQKAMEMLDKFSKKGPGVPQP